MLQNLISSQVHSNSNCSHPTPPPPFFRPYKEPNILKSTSLNANWMMEVQGFFLFYCFSLVSPFVHFKAVVYNQEKVHMTFNNEVCNGFLRPEQRFNVKSENDLKTTP